MNHLGDIGESYAEYVLTSLGYTLFYTKSGHCPFDLIIKDSDNNLYKIQVKYTSSLQKRSDANKGYYRITFKKGTSAVNYNKSDLDYYICIIDVNGKKIVYMLPFGEIDKVFKLPEDGLSEKYEKYKIWTD